MLKETFIDLLSRYTNDRTSIHELWLEIEQNYSNPARHYHTLNHLDNLLNQLEQVKTEIIDWDCILFTLYYHDVIYNAVKSDNEERSAELAEKRMKEIGLNEETIETCKNQIIATKSHGQSTESDTNYFIDADLSVLGQSWEVYSQYFKNVRKEYSVYPDEIYNPGRKKVLSHFLDMERIFKTTAFYDQFEAQAKINLQQEISVLNL